MGLVTYAFSQADLKILLPKKSGRKKKMSITWQVTFSNTIILKSLEAKLF